MSTKLPFSASRDQNYIDPRVMNGLVPSKDNKTKQLTQEQERMYTLVLES